MLHFLLYNQVKCSHTFVAMKNERIFEELKDCYGNHSKAAKALDVDPRHYRHWRSTGKLPKFVKKYLELILSKDGNGNGAPDPQATTE